MAKAQQGVFLRRRMRLERFFFKSWGVSPPLENSSSSSSFFTSNFRSGAVPPHRSKNRGTCPHRQFELGVPLGPSIVEKKEKKLSKVR